MEPLTVQLTDEQMKRKQDQQRARAPPPGQSRILSRAARDHRRQGGKQIQQMTSKAPETTANNKENQPPVPVVAPTVQPTATASPNNKTDQPTKESVRKSVEQISNINKTNADVKASKVFENATETDDWQMLIEELTPETNQEMCEKMMRDEPFLLKLKQKLQTSKTLVLEGKIDGASMYRDICRVINNLLSVEFEEVYDDDDDDYDEEAGETITSKKEKEGSRSRRDGDMSNRLASLEYFCNYMDISGFFVEFLKMFISNKSNIKLLKEVILFFILNFYII